MIDTNFESIIDLFDTFDGDQACIEYLEGMMWEDGVVSPFYEESTVYECKPVLIKCKTTKKEFSLKRYYCKASGKYFNVKTGTVFEGTKLPLRKFFGIIWLMMTKKNISGQAVADQLKIMQCTAWLNMKKIQNCLDCENNTKLRGTIEVDECYIGGLEHNKHNIKRLKKTGGRSLVGKEAVFGAVQRPRERKPARVKLQHIPNVTSATLTHQIFQWVHRFSYIYSDDYVGYHHLKYHDYVHRTVNHSWRQYVDGKCHTNTIEGIWSLFKRNIVGIHHHVSPKYLQLYLNWFVFKFNTKDYTIRQRFDLVLKNMSHKITYTELVHG